MTKQELLSKVAKASGISVKDVQKVLHFFQSAVLEDLKTSSSVNVLDLGQLKVSTRSSRTGINPRTKEKIQIPSRQVPKLSASKKFKGFVEGNVDLNEFRYYSE